jgi:energy-coupling factor transporter ATP-binding protein EcfA2
MTRYPARRIREPVVSARPVIPLHGRIRGEQERGRVIAVFGARGVGKSTLIKVAHEESETATVVVVRGELLPDDRIFQRIMLEEAVTAAQSGGAEVVFLDGMPGSVEEVQWLYDMRFVSPVSGAMVRIERNVVRDDAFLKTLHGIDERAVALAMPYFVVRSDDAVVGVADLLARSGIER